MTKINTLLFAALLSTVAAVSFAQPTEANKAPAASATGAMDAASKPVKAKKVTHKTVKKAKHKAAVKSAAPAAAPASATK